MDKAIFSITCTTCQARLIVRSEAAIGAILECPRCESMVQVIPPEGWKPTPPPAQAPLAALPAVPPPLDRVAAVPPVLELEPPDTSPLNMLLRQKWLAWGVAPLATLMVICVLLWMAFSRPELEPAAMETENPTTIINIDDSIPKRPTTAATNADLVNERPATTTDSADSVIKRPATAVAGMASDQSPTSPGPRSGGVKEPATVQPPSPPSTLPSSPTNAKPPEPDLFPVAAEEAEDARQIEIKKVPPATVDVAARLADPIAQLELIDMPLAKAVDLLAAMGVLPVTMDADAMMRLGVAPRDPISLQLGSTTVGKALQAAVARKGLAVAVENGQVVVGAPEEYRETLRKVRYTVADLTGDDKAAVAELAALVRKLVAPESWQQTGGRGTIEADQGALVVVQTGEVHPQVLVFCEKLRNARHKPLRSRDNPDRFTLTTRLDQARKMLDRPVTANFHEPAPLAGILAFLAEAAGSDILIDRAALAAAETSDRVETTLTATKQAFRTVLADLLRPLGLTYRAVGQGVIQVTTEEAAEERLELEFYPVGPWLAKQNSPLPRAPTEGWSEEGQLHPSPLPLGEGQGVRAVLPLAEGQGVPHDSPLPLGEGPRVRGPALAERLKTRVAASTWSDVGGSGEVYFDPPSQCLIVLQSQPAQAAVQRLLETSLQKKE